MKHIFFVTLFCGLFFSSFSKNETETTVLKEFTTKLNTIKNDAEDLSVGLITLFVLKKNVSQVFENSNLAADLEKIIKKLPKQLPIATLFDLHSAMDFWYFTKLLGYKDQYKVSENILSEHLDPKELEEITDPGEALLYWIIISSLLLCDSKKYDLFKRFLPTLEKTCEENKYVYAYLLTHIILYESEFGNKKPSHDSENTLKRLEMHIKKIPFELHNIDILAETIWCAKLCAKEKKSTFKKLEKKLHSLTSFSYFHEQCMVLLATLPFN